MDLKKMTARQRENYHYMADAMRRLEWDLHHHIEATARIPVEWHEIAQERHPKKKVRVTLCLEEDVLRFFKSMGTGHGPRINEVLRTWMHARLAGVIRGADSDPWFRRAEELHDGPRPMWGDISRDLGDAAPPAPDEVQAERMALLREQARLRGLEDG
jgi:uncharacterized protein (DUF4415 family)